MSYFEWLNPTAEQLEQANVFAGRLGVTPYWVGDKLCVGQRESDPISPTPEAVTAHQARLALLGAGKLSLVDAALAAMPGVQGEAARIEWEYASEIRRDSPLIAALAPALGLTAEQVDDMFRMAVTL